MIRKATVEGGVVVGIPAADPGYGGSHGPAHYRGMLQAAQTLRQSGACALLRLEGPDRLHKK